MRANIVAIHEEMRGILVRHGVLSADEAILPPFGPTAAQPWIQEVWRQERPREG